MTGRSTAAYGPCTFGDAERKFAVHTAAIPSSMPRATYTTPISIMSAAPTAERKDGIGGWHDAGDYNKYTVNGAFTAGMMLQAWEHFSDRLAALKFDIPESENDVPDFLDEVRWELDWLLKMQADDGRVYHKLSTLQVRRFHPAGSRRKARRYFSPWGTAATADLAAIMAQARGCFVHSMRSFADRCLTARRRAMISAHRIRRIIDRTCRHSQPVLTMHRQRRSAVGRRRTVGNDGEVKYVSTAVDRAANSTADERIPRTRQTAVADRRGRLGLGQPSQPRNVHLRAVEATGSRPPLLTRVRDGCDSRCRRNRRGSGAIRMDGHSVPRIIGAATAPSCGRQ